MLEGSAKNSKEPIHVIKFVTLLSISFDGAFNLVAGALVLSIHIKQGATKGRL